MTDTRQLQKKLAKIADVNKLGYTLLGLHAEVASSVVELDGLAPAQRDLVFVASDIDQDPIEVIEALRRDVKPAALFYVADTTAPLPKVGFAVDAIMQRPVLRDDLRRCLRNVAEPTIESVPESKVEEPTAELVPSFSIQLDHEPRWEIDADHDWLVQEAEAIAEHPVWVEPDETDPFEKAGARGKQVEATTGWEFEPEDPKPLQRTAEGANAVTEQDVEDDPNDHKSAHIAEHEDEATDQGLAPPLSMPPGEAGQVVEEPGGGSGLKADEVIDAGFDVTEAEFDLITPAPRVSEDGPRPMRVLVAEDNRTNRLVIEKMLKHLHIELKFAENGEEAVELYQWQPPDIMFTDISMPKMDGKEAAGRIRQIEQETQADRCPIVAITAHAMEGDAEAILEAGIDHYLTEPIKKSELIAQILEHQPAETEAVLTETDQAAAASAR